MIAQSATLIPPLHIFDYPVKIIIRVLPDGNMMLFPEDRNPVRALIPLSHIELANINQQLQDAINNLAISNEVAATWTLDEMNEALRPLAELGYYTFLQIFQDQETQFLIQSLPKGSCIEIVSENFVLPWQLLYLESMEDSVSCYHFLGMKFVFSNILVGEGTRRGPSISSRIYTHPEPHIGLLGNNALASVVEKEIPYFQKLAKAKLISLIELRTLDPKSKNNGLKEFSDFWMHAFHIAHFACHADFSEAGPNMSEIVVSNNFSITLQDLVTRRIRINNHPLVIMNACETNTLNPLYSSHFAAWFLDNGARGVVTTECAVSDSFAADFIQKLYDLLLVGKNVGESLLLTRQHFWENFSNPSGLLYTMYGPPAIRLSRQDKVGEG